MSENTWDDQRITDYVLGDMSDDDRTAFESEMAEHPDLAAAVEEAQGLTDQLQSLYASEATQRLEPTRRQAITSHPATVMESTNRSSSQRIWLALAVAACVLLLVGVPPLLERWNASQTVTQTFDQDPGPVERAVDATRNTEENELAAFGDEASAVADQGIADQGIAGGMGGDNGAVVSGFGGDSASTPSPKLGSPSLGQATLAEQINRSQADDTGSPSDDSRVLADTPQPESLIRGRNQQIGAAPNRPNASRGLGGGSSNAMEQPAPFESEVGSRPGSPSPPLDDPSQRLGGRSNLSVAPDGQSASAMRSRSSTQSGSSPAPSPPSSPRGTPGTPKASPGTPKASPGTPKASPGTPKASPGTPKASPGTRGNIPNAPGDRQNAPDATQSSRAMQIPSATQNPSAPATKPGINSGVMRQQGRAALSQPRGSQSASTPNPIGNRAAPLPSPAQPGDGVAIGGGGGAAIGPQPAAPAGRATRRLKKIEPPTGGRGGFGNTIDEGRGPGIGGDQFDPITDNDFRRVDEHPFSTFSVDVDTASYSKVRDFLLRAKTLPRRDAVRIEELVNYFDYDYEPPADDAEHPFATHTVVTGCPWNDDHRLARVALQGKTMTKDERPPCNLVFLIDTSGSMNAPNKLPLVVEGMKMLLNQLGENDRVAIAVYAGSAGLVLDSTPATKLRKIRNALTELDAGGSTNGGAGIALAYQAARDAFIDDGINRVILCTDGDFNVGTTGTDELVRMVEKEAKGNIFLSVLGFGMGNHNDAMLEQISGRGNGNYAFIDNVMEARKVLVEQISGTLVTIAKDVKIQIEFNPRQVSAYRLIGYENRILAKEDFNNDEKDAGEIGAGHSVTALYEIVPAGVESNPAEPRVDELKYQTSPQLTDAANSSEMMTLKLNYKQPDGFTSTRIEFPVVDDDEQFERSSDDVRFAAAVAGFGMQLRGSKHAGSWTMADVLKTAESARGDDQSGLRAEFLELVKQAESLK